MTVIQILGTLRAFGVDVLLIALGVTLLTSLLKKTLLKEMSGKLFVFLPFALGILLYAVYRMAATWSVAPIAEDILSTFEGGFASGSCATLYYCVYKQFLRGGRSEVSPLLPILKGFVPEEQAEPLAKALTEGGKGKAEEELEPFVRETVLSFVPDVSEGDLALAVPLIAKFLSEL